MASTASYERKLVAPSDTPESRASIAKSEQIMKRIYTKDTVNPIGPYSKGVKTIKPIKNWIFLAGQVPILPDDTVLQGTAAEKTHLMCQNVKSCLEAAGSSLDKVVKVTIYFTDISEYEESNSVYLQYFPHVPPRVCVEIKGLPEKGLTMQLDVTAVETED